MTSSLVPLLHTYCSLSLSVLSPGEVPDTREALLSAFKRLDNDMSLEAQVRTECRERNEETRACSTFRVRTLQMYHCIVK